MKGEYICEYKGELINLQEAKKRETKITSRRIGCMHNPQFYIEQPKGEDYAYSLFGGW